ncbi:MAG: murein biosynthesis integral membrane protein MurJ [Sporomusaceae bacterium]|nr:murein biosynthesis integral membrane protein MurJ [Sporomusaceae bacterium]
MVSRIIGLIREMVFAAFFGVSADMDVFLLAQVLPCTISTVLATSILAAFIPVYSRHMAKNGLQAGSELANRIVSGIFALATVFSILAYFAAPGLAALLVPDWPQETRTKTIELVRILLPCFTGTLLLAVFNGVQQAGHRFIFPYLGPIVFNLTIVVSVLVFGTTGNIYVLGNATTVGVLLQIMIQLYGLNQMHFKFSFVQPTSIFPKELMAFLLPALMVTIIVDAAFIIDRMFVSLLPTGSIAALNYAYRVNSLTVNLVANSIAAGSYPVIAACVGRADYNEMNRNIGLSIRMALFATIPAMVLILAFSEPIIDLLFQRGSFGATAVAKTSMALFFLSFGMLGAGVLGILGQANCALQKSGLLLRVAAAMITVKLALSLAFVRIMAADGLALATSGAYLVGGGALLWLWNKDSNTAGAKIWRSAKQSIVAAGIMGLSSKVFFYLVGIAILPAIMSSPIMADRVGLIVTVCFAGAVYLGVLAYVKSEGFEWAREIFLRSKTKLEILWR